MQFIDIIHFPQKLNPFFTFYFQCFKFYETKSIKVIAKIENKTCYKNLQYVFVSQNSIFYNNFFYEETIYVANQKCSFIFLFHRFTGKYCFYYRLLLNEFSIFLSFTQCQSVFCHLKTFIIFFTIFMEYLCK